MSGSFRGMRAVAVAAVAAAVLAGAGGVGYAGPGAGGVDRAAATASPGPVGPAARQVRRTLTEIHALNRRVAAAQRRYAAALNQVAAGVTEVIAADRNRADVQRMLQASHQRLAQQVLALYASGGQFATTASLLAPGGLAGYATTSHAESEAVARTVALAQDQRRLDAAAGRQVSASRRKAQRSIATARDVAAAANRVQRLLARQSALLAAAQRRLAAARQLAAARAALAAEASRFAVTTATGVDQIGVLPPSPAYLSWYRGAAATCPGLPWTVLAAIGQVESGHGRNDGPSSAGALGPMQFLPGTFAAYAVDGDHDGQVNIEDPADAIFTAAHYLCVNGAGRGTSALAGAIWHYNHATWYVQLVLTLAGKYAQVYG